jgi:succinyl-diaminopimelate desuccinylase
MKGLPLAASIALLFSAVSGVSGVSGGNFDLKRLDAVYAGAQADFSRDLVALLSIPSVSTDRKETDRALEAFLAMAGKLGFSTRKAAGGEVGIAEIGPEGAGTLGILVHVDVVPVEGQDWSFPPFEGKLKEGWFLGRGAIDDKGPALASLYAAKAVADLGLTLRKKIQIIAGTREEISWSDMQAYVADNPLPDFGFTPDDSFPGSNREKGYADLRWSFPISEAVTGKSGFRIVELSGGNALNTVPARAEAILEGDAARMRTILEDNRARIPAGEGISLELADGRMRLIATGKSAHSSLPEEGVNAIWALMRFLSLLPLEANGAERLVAFCSRYLVDDHFGTKLGLWSPSEYLNGEFIHRTTVVPSLLETKGGEMALSCNLRLAFGIGSGEIDKALSAIESEFGSSGSILEYLAPLYVAKNTPFMQAVSATYAEFMGNQDEMGLAMGTSYAKAMPNIVAWGPLFPDDEDFCHMADERIKAESLLKAGQIYARLIARVVLGME